jgi:hypothetical protein
MTSFYLLNSQPNLPYYPRAIGVVTQCLVSLT